LGLIAVVQNIIIASPEWIQGWLSEPIQIGNRTIEPSLDLEQVTEQLVTAIQPLLSQSAQIVGLAASTTISWVGWAILIFVLSIYFAIDMPRFGNLMRDAVAQPGYLHDVEQLLWHSRRIWNGYLRGQTTLAVLMALIFMIMLNILGVRYALVLGMLAGILAFFPYIGPFTIIALSTLVAFFQGSNWLGLSPLWFAVVVMLAGFIIQQIEGNWLNPWIVGGATGLHPLLAIIGALMGGALAGLLGVLLAAPILATLKLLGTYIWRKMFDLDPFPEPDESPPAVPDVEAVPVSTPAPEARAKQTTL
jgi:predicted PurR-regulated permease PerM